MTKTSLVALCILVLGGCTPESPPETARNPILDFATSKPLDGETFSHSNEEVLLPAEKGGRPGLFAVSLTSGRIREVATDLPGPVRRYSFFPNDNRIVFSSIIAKTDQEHIFVREESGILRDITPGDQTRANYYGWDADRDTFYYGSNQVDRRYLHLFKFTQAEPKPTLVLQTQDTTFASASADGRYLGLFAPKSAHEVEASIFDLEERKFVRLAKSTSSSMPQVFEDDLERILYLSNSESLHLELWARNLQTSETELVLSEPGKNMLFARMSAGGRFLITGHDEGGKVSVRLHKVHDGSQYSLPSLAGKIWEILDISRDERWMTFRYADERPKSTGRYAYDLDTHEIRTLYSGSTETR